MYRALRRSAPQVARAAPSAASPTSPSCSCSRHLLTAPSGPTRFPAGAPSSACSVLQTKPLVASPILRWISSRGMWTCAAVPRPPPSNRRRFDLPGSSSSSVRSVTTKKEVQGMGDALDRVADAVQDQADESIQPDATASSVNLDLVHCVLPKREVEALPQHILELIARKVEQIGAPGKTFDEMSFQEIQTYHAKFYKAVTPEERLAAARGAVHTEQVDNQTLAQAGVRPESLIEPLSDAELAAQAASAFRDFERDMREAPSVKPEMLNYQLFLALSHGAASERVARARYVVSRAKHFGHEDKLDKALVEEIARVEATNEGKSA